MLSYCWRLWTSQWIEKIPNEPSHLCSHLIEKSDAESETSNFPPPVFIPVGGNRPAQSNVDIESIIPLHAPGIGLPNISFVDLDHNPIAPYVASVADSNHSD